MSDDLPMCDKSHCGDKSAQINKICKKNDWQVNHLVMICNDDGDCCTCTCSCLAYNTPVLVPNDNTKVIQDFKIGDPVVAFDPNGNSGVYEVAFSDGTAPESVQPEMAYLTYEVAGNKQTIVVTLDHTFLIPSGKLILASMLRPGMEISLSAGGATEILEMQVKGYTGGVWNISTSVGEPESLDGHLLDTQGVLSGDYAVQLFYSDFAARGLAIALGDEPEVLTAGYDRATGENGLAAARSSPPTKTVQEFLADAAEPTHLIAGGGDGSGGVVLHHDHSFVLEVPAGAGEQGFLTNEQAAEASAKLQPETMRSANTATLLNWLTTLFSAFYEDVTFVIDSPNRGANAFAFRLGDQKYILIQGGLFRTKGVEWQGIALILGYSVARFERAGTVGEDGLQCKPQSDYDAIGVLANVFYPLYPDMVFDAIKQIKGLFGDLSDKADNPVSGCHGTTLECRGKTYSAALALDDLPVCAGGPVPPMLDVEGAKGNADGTVSVTFSDFVDKASAQTVANYGTDPASAISAAKVSTDDGKIVILTGDFEAGADYTLTVEKVKSIVGDPLNPDANSAKFKMP